MKIHARYAITLCVYVGLFYAAYVLIITFGPNAIGCKPSALLKCD